ncbi:MAG: ComEC family competence protein [Chitinophagaceae bacterium]|nr:ComEC family competence protein [Chitinophagaceae bacterium]
MSYYRQIPLWKKVPFIRLLIPVVAGIILAKYISISASNLALGAVAAVIILFYFSSQKAATRFSYSFIPGIAITMLLCISGIVLFQLHDVKRQRKWYGHSLNNTTVWTVKAQTTLQEKPKSYRVDVELIFGFNGVEQKEVTGQAILYLAKDSNAAGIRRGDLLLIKNKLQEPENAGFSDGFDYKNYLANQQIYHQAYLTSKEWLPTGENRLSAFDMLVERSLNYINRVFETYLKGGQVIALAKALMTGNRTELDRDLVQAYSNAGVVHIMAISGLHLGLIYILLLKIAKITPLIFRNKYAKAGFIIGGIWFFAVMTGGSPSVLRSAVMFSCLHIGQLLNSRVPTYNYWSASALLLLVFNPLLLWNVGFQLSYMAVLGILIVQKPIYHWISFDNKIVDYAWQLMSVSIAAQLFTLPFCIYYFHQFPVLFLITNLIAIPVASVGLWAGVILILTGWLPFIPKLLGTTVTFIFKSLNAFILYINSFTFTVLGNISFTLLESYLFGAILLFVLIWLMRKSVFALKAALFCTAVFFSVRLFL